MSNNILAREQYGFRNKSSTETATYKLINEVLNALNNGMFVGGIFVIWKDLLIVSIMILNCPNWYFMEWLVRLALRSSLISVTDTREL
jgi:hypothetical protein